MIGFVLIDNRYIDIVLLRDTSVFYPDARFDDENRCVLIAS